MAKRGLKLFGMGIGALAIIAGIVVGILFATGVLKNKELFDGSSDGTQIKTYLSNIQIGGHMSGKVNENVNFNVTYDPFPLEIGITKWTLNKTAIFTYKSGKTQTINVSTDGVFYVDYIEWETIPNGLFNEKEVPAKVEISANVSYIDKNGSLVTGPQSNSVSLNIPTD